MCVPPVLSKVREATWFVLALAFVAYAVLAATISGLYAGSVGQAIEDLQRSTAGLAAPPLVANLPVLAIMSLIIFGIGRLRPADVGWQDVAVGPAVVTIVAFWIAMQGALALGVLFSDHPLQWHKDWQRPGFVAGLLLGQLLGTAFIEEMVFRGFLLPEFYVKASRHGPCTVAVVTALLGSLLAFSLFHLPHDLFVRNIGGLDLLAEQWVRFKVGFLYAAVYLITRNLFVGVGLHAIFNEPASLVQVSRSDAQGVWYVFVLILLVAWPLARRFRTRKQAPNLSLQQTAGA